MNARGANFAGIVLALAAFVVASGEARACTPIRYADDGHYVGGDLVEQVAEKAHTIQIVHARARHLLTRHFTRTESLWWNGRPTERRGPSHRDIYVFELEVEETLKGGDFGTPQTQAREILVRARDERTDPHLWISYNYMLAMMMERPGHDGMFLEIAAVDPEQGGAGSCYSPLSMRVGHRYLILRDERGVVQSPTLVDGEWQNRLSVDVVFRRQDDAEEEQFTIAAPGVLRMDESATQFSQRLSAILSRH